jgi:uncharacterized protein YyaL (SSP411 family)
MSLLSAWEDYRRPLQIVIIRGSAAEARRWAESLRAEYAPARMIFAIPDDAPNLPPALADKRPGADAVAYLCTGTTCSAPFTTLAAAREALGVRA